MIKMDGDNVFESGIFAPERWSAPVIQDPAELAACLRKYSVAGRRITAIHSVGPAYNFTREWLNNAAFAAMMANTDPDKAFPPVAEVLPDDTVLNRLMLVDKPVILEFETGDTLAVDFSRPAEVRVSLNTLPKELKALPDCDNVDTAMLFSEIIGRRVLGMQVGRRKDLPEDWPQPTGEDWKNQETLIAFLMFQMEGGVGLAFEPYRDTCRVFVIGREKKIHTVSYGMIKPFIRPDAYTPPEPEEN